MDPIMINRVARIRAAEMIQISPTRRSRQSRKANWPVATFLNHLGSALITAGTKLQVAQPISEANTPAQA